jgi:hypothetical protein
LTITLIRTRGRVGGGLFPTNADTQCSIQVFFLCGITINFEKWNVGASFSCERISRVREMVESHSGEKNDDCLDRPSFYFFFIPLPFLGGRGGAECGRERLM